MITDNTKKFKRTVKIIAVLSKYGFEDVVSRSGLKNWVSPKILETSPAVNELLSLSVYERIRLALEDLGPAYIKFGQMFSSREDLLPVKLVAELQKLQDNAGIQEQNVREKLKSELNIEPDEYFSSIEDTPFAAASVSQIYKAQLINGRQVVLKIKRENIEETIEADLLIMKDLVKYLEEYKEEYKKINLSHILETFEAAIYEELSFTNEYNNIKRFERNFTGTDIIHVPETYKELSNNNILCMEMISGIKITDTTELEQNNFDLRAIAQAGFDLYMEQVLNHGFFHADPHPGNIFVTGEGKIVFIDFGLMGTILPNDKEYLEQFVLYLFQKDVEKIMKTLKRMAITYSVKDERKLYKDIYSVLAKIESSELERINIGELITLFKAIFQDNEIVLPEYLYLLMKGMALIEGIGRILYPELNIPELLKPYAYRVIQRKLSPGNIISESFKNAKGIAQTMADLPEDIKEVIQMIKNNNFKINHEVSGLKEISNAFKATMNYVVLAIIIAALSVGSAILVMANMPPKIYGIPVLGFAGFVISAVLGISIVTAILRGK